MENELGLTNIESTLLLPLKGRVFATKNFPYVLKDEIAVSIASKLPEKYMDTKKDSEYTLLQQAVRSLNMNVYVKTFLAKYPNAVIINLGCGLDTLFNRCDNGTSKWYEIDLKEVTDLRRKLIGETERDRILTYSMFEYDWMKEIKDNNEGPFLVVASDVFQYFPQNIIVDLLKNIKNLGRVEILFDAVSMKGMKDTQKYMKRFGYSESAMYFYVDDAYHLANEVEPSSNVIFEKDFYEFIKDKSKFKLFTKMKMKMADKLDILKIIQIKL